MIKQPMFTKVFLALRTNFIPELESEHITLNYFNEIRWDAVLEFAEKYDSQLPATIHLLSPHTWEGFDGGTFYGFNVACHDSEILSHLKMPHITVPKFMMDQLDPYDLDSVQVIDRLYLGKKVNGKLIWTKLKDKEIGLDNDNAANWI